MNRLPLVGVCLLAAACGTAEITEEASPPVVLHALDATPGCYVPLNPTVGISSSAVGSNSTSLMTQMAEMDLAFAMQHAALLLQPVLDNPTAREWRVDGFGDARIEGQSLARGDGWGELSLILLSETATRRADVSYDPEATQIVLQYGVLIQTDDYVRLNSFVLGCDPVTGTSFRYFGSAWGAECWDQYGEPLTPPQAEVLPGGTGSIGMSQETYCAQLISRLTIR